MYLSRALQILWVFLWLVGCQTIDLSEEKEPCAERDWFELGRSDGTKGVPNLNWQERAKACKGFAETHHQSYINGWYAGVDDFCSPNHAYLFGRTGLTYYNVCPASKEREFTNAYQKGLQVFLYEKNNQRLNEEIRQLETSSDKETQLNKIENLLEERAENQKQISNIEDQMNSRVR